MPHSQYRPFRSGGRSIDKFSRHYVDYQYVLFRQHERDLGVQSAAQMDMENKLDEGAYGRPKGDQRTKTVMHTNRDEDSSGSSRGGVGFAAGIASCALSSMNQ